jgi:hypothetical protein
MLGKLPAVTLYVRYRLPSNLNNYYIDLKGSGAVQVGVVKIISIRYPNSSDLSESSASRPNNDQVKQIDIFV